MRALSASSVATTVWSMAAASSAALRPPLGCGGAQRVGPRQRGLDAHSKVGEFVAAGRVEFGLRRRHERVEAEQFVTQVRSVCVCVVRASSAALRRAVSCATSRPARRT